MSREIRIQWNKIYGGYFVTDDSGATTLPHVSDGLAVDVDAWKQYLHDHFEVHHPDDIRGGRWANGDGRSYAQEARRLEREFAREVPRGEVVVTVDPFPGVVVLRLFADYTWWPVWDGYGLTDPADFPEMSSGLRLDLETWALEVEVGEGDRAVGEPLAQRLRDELGPDFEVHY